MSELTPTTLAEKRRQLRLETLYDLLVALHSHSGEEELVEDLLERVCAALDPAAAAIVTRDRYGAARSASLVGWQGAPPSAQRLLDDPVWQALLSSGGAVERRAGDLAGRAFRHMLAVPLAYRGTYLGYLAILDKEARRASAEDVEGEAGASFSPADLRFLVAVAALAGVTLDGLRNLATIKTRSERLELENRALREQFAPEVAGQRIVAQAPPMRQVLEIVERVAPRGVNVLVRGESGTGKELIAKLLHAWSERSGPLVAVNCAALPEGLLESELFGIERGVATGVDARAGKFELADGGTLFLDEIGDLDHSLQVKLLRTLQEREIVRVGGSSALPVDVRVVSATHQPLGELLESGRFREDLYYRLRGVEVELAPLRERREDIPHLVRHLLERFCEAEGIAVPAIDAEALDMLMAQDFPGNVRELQNLIEGAASLAEERIGVELLQSLTGWSETEGPQALDLDTVQRRHIRRVLKMVDGNKSAASRLLGIDRRTLARRGF